MTIPEKIEQLKIKLNKIVDEREEGNLLRELLFLYNTQNDSKFKFDSERLIEIGNKLDDLNFKAWGIYFRGNQIFHEGNSSVALDDYQVALGYFYDAKIPNGIMAVYCGIGIIFAAQGKYSEAIENYLFALKISEEVSNQLYKASLKFNIACVYKPLSNFKEALNYCNDALNIYKSIKSKEGIGAAYNLLGNIYLEQGQYIESLRVLRLALKIFKELGDNLSIAMAYGNIGNANWKLNNYKKALTNHLSSLEILELVGAQQLIAREFVNVGEIYIGLNNHITASEYLNKGLILSEKIGAKEELSLSLKGLYELNKDIGDSKLALDFYEKFTKVENELKNEDTNKKIATLDFEYKIEKKDQEVFFERQKKVELQIAYDLLDKEKQRSEKLLLNILPAEVAEELKNKGSADAKLFDEVTVLFTDFKSFTTVSEKLTPQELVNELNECFKAFDEIIGKYNIEKIKTVGDAYLAAAGLPSANPTHADDMINAALEIRDFMVSRKKLLGDRTFEMRAGIHSGPVVAGIVGVKKFAYDIWGDTVNTAARMEQNGEAGKVNISEATYELVKDKFTCEYRGEIEAKNKGKLKMYFVV